MEKTIIENMVQLLMSEPDNSQLLSSFMNILASGQLLVLTEDEEGEAPYVLDFEGGKTVLAFESEAHFASGFSSSKNYTLIEGRILFESLAQEFIGLSLNMGSSTSEYFLSPEQINWFIGFEKHPASFQSKQIAKIKPPLKLDPADFEVISRWVLARAPFLSYAVLIGVDYAEGGEALSLALSFKDEAFIEKISAEFSDMVSGLIAMPAHFDLLILEQDSKSFALAQQFGIVIALDDLVYKPLKAPIAPGSDPNKPPKLR